MKLDTKKIKALILTYGIPTLPLASAAFALNASLLIKVLSFASGAIVVIGRQANPKDPFTLNLLAIAKQEIDATLKNQTKKQ